MTSMETGISVSCVKIRDRILKMKQPGIAVINVDIIKFQSLKWLSTKEMSIDENHGNAAIVTSQPLRSIRWITIKWRSTMKYYLHAPNAATELHLHQI